ncbi:unnamed protein product [Dicrocoelium dendriticum]|nr:unnamed protein product [Dicrocoelium dendriticum]
MSVPNVKPIQVHMPEDMLNHAVECCREALQNFSDEKDMAAHIKSQFDAQYNPNWHCILGRQFGSYVQYEENHFVELRAGPLDIVLFKTART